MHPPLAIETDSVEYRIFGPLIVYPNWRNYYAFRERLIPLIKQRLNEPDGLDPKVRIFPLQEKRASRSLSRRKGCHTVVYQPKPNAIGSPGANARVLNRPTFALQSCNS
jgi:hypothetical protein